MKKYEKISITFKEAKIKDILLNGIIGIDDVVSGTGNNFEDPDYVYED